MARRTSGRAKGAVRTVNMKGVDTKRQVLPEDDYPVAVSEMSIEKGEKGEYYKWIFEVTEGKHEGAKLYYNTSLVPEALFNLKGLIVALGFEVPDDEMEIDPKEYIGAEMMAVVMHERYNGKLQSKIGDFYAMDSDDAKDAKEPRGGRSRGDKDEAEPRRGRASRDDPPERTSRREERDEKEPRGRRGAKKGPDPISAEEVEEMSQKELEGLVEELELDVDFGKFRTLTKQRNAVIDALTDAELLAE